MLKIVFAHGLEGSPHGTKATYLREAFGATAPELASLGLDDQVSRLTEALDPRRETVLIGSSLGALAALGLVQENAERIAHLILLAPAVGTHKLTDAFRQAEQHRPGMRDAVERYSELAIPRGLPATILHGLLDEIVPLDDVLGLFRRSPSSRLVLTHADHSLIQCKREILSLAARAAHGRDPFLETADSAAQLH